MLRDPSMLRVIFKLVVFVFVLGVIICLMPLKFIFPNQLARSWKKMLVKIGSTILIYVFGIKINVRGKTPKKPFILVSNHLSYVDILLFFYLSDCIFVAKKEVGRWRLLGIVVKLTGTIFIDRENIRDGVRVNHLIRRIYKDNGGIVIFPEGTSTKGETVLDFNPMLLKSAIDLECPVYYASIRYTKSVDVLDPENSVCWWGDSGFLEHFKNFLKLKSIQSDVIFGEEAVLAKDARSLAKKLHTCVKQQFIPML